MASCGSIRAEYLARSQLGDTIPTRTPRNRGENRQRRTFFTGLLEIASREYDRAFVDGATISDLQETQVVEASSKLQLGMTPWHFIQHYGLAEYSNTGLRLRRAALLLFAKDINRWHPRSQIRIVRVGGTELRVGADYNAMPDKVVSGNIVELVRSSWETLREYLVVMRLTPEGTFQPSAIYPDAACQEALINALAHRDYAQEGRGIEIFIFHDRIEIKSPGALLSTVGLDVLRSAIGVHESRNTFVARTLKLLGYMQELGEGVRRIFSLMSYNELAPPVLESTETTFSVTLSNKPVYSDDELLWLERYKHYELSRAEKAVLLLGRSGRLLSTNEIMRAVGFTDTSDFTALITRLGKLELIKSTLRKRQVELIRFRENINRRDVPRFVLVDISARSSDTLAKIDQPRLSTPTTAAKPPARPYRGNSNPPRR